MAIKLFSKLFSRKKRIAMTSDEAFLSDESDEPRDEVPKEEPAPQPEPQPAAPAPPENKQEMKPQPSGKHISPLDLLLKDRERTLILALLILLSSEDSNTELLFALMYLLI